MQPGWPLAPVLWRTIEEAIAIVCALEEAARPGDCVLFDCITVWISNLLLRHVSDVDHPASDEVAGASGAIRLELERLLEWCRGYDGQVIVVSNEVGMSVVPPYPLGRVFRDIVGSANQAVATAADRTYFVVAGQALDLRAMGAMHVASFDTSERR